MSKTFDASSVNQAVRTYWKRFAASVTGLLNKYRSDPFFHTEINVIALQIAFALVIVSVIAIAFGFLYHDVSLAIIQGIRAGIASDAPTSMGPAIVREIEAIRAENLAFVVVIITAITILFGYIIGRIVLAPTRNSLAAQKQFIGNIAHELRTPLSVIKTNTEVALLEEMSAELKTMLYSNIQELDRISEIINNLLSLSALVHPERIEFSVVDLSELVSDVIQKYSALAKKNNIQITFRKTPGGNVWGNTTALQQIVGNLLKNAITYTPRGGQVSLTVGPDMQTQEVELIIRDSGIGIARKDLFRIFEPFYRSDPSRVRMQQASGSGLGLTIVSELLKMHQGKISVRSAVGRGTTVSVLLPGIREPASVGGAERLREGLSEIAVDFSEKTN